MTNIQNTDYLIFFKSYFMLDSFCKYNEIVIVLPGADIKLFMQRLHIKHVFFLLNPFNRINLKYLNIHFVSAQSSKCFSLVASDEVIYKTAVKTIKMN